MSSAHSPNTFTALRYAKKLMFYFSYVCADFFLVAHWTGVATANVCLLAFARPMVCCKPRMLLCAVVN